MLVVIIVLCVWLFSICEQVIGSVECDSCFLISCLQVGLVVGIIICRFGMCLEICQVVLKNGLFRCEILLRWLFGNIVSILVEVGRLSVVCVFLWLFCSGMLLVIGWLMKCVLMLCLVQIGGFIGNRYSIRLVLLLIFFVCFLCQVQIDGLM